MLIGITGRPGDGKSLVGTRNLLEDLIEGVFVVTNIPLNLPDLAAYVNSERGRRKIEEPFVVDESLKVIPDSLVYEFYRVRADGLLLPPSPDFECDARNRMDRPEFMSKMKETFALIKAAGVRASRPVHYYIDEAHNFFSAREWANTGRGLLYYASQHRHLHDNIFMITQVIENLEKQLRGLMSELWTVRNDLRRSFSIVRMRPVFRLRKYYGIPNVNQPGVHAFEEVTIQLDPARVAACYNTVGALGVQTKPEKLKNSGWLPWWAIWVFGAVIVVAIPVFLFGIPFLTARTVQDKFKETGPASPALHAPDRTALPPVSGRQFEKIEGVGPRATPAPAIPAPQGPVFVRSLVVTAQDCLVTLEDGRIVSRATGVERITPDSVFMVDGTRHPRRRGAAPQGPAPAAPGHAGR